MTKLEGEHVRQRGSVLDVSTAAKHVLATNEADFNKFKTTFEALSSAKMNQGT
jgi:hypothetical protein